MCKTTYKKFKELKACSVSALLRNFPACNVRYRNFGDFGLVLVHPSIRNQKLIKDKVDAAKIKAKKNVFVVEIPQIIANAVGI